jgi:hypothetical protein
LSATGDISMRIESDMVVRLDSGQATAHVPEQAHGFTIKTRDAEMVDLGTEFGVMARKGGATDVVVFAGMIDLKPTARLNSRQIRLTQGEGARIDHQGSVGRIVEVRCDFNSNRWSTDNFFSKESTIKGVSDNLRSSDSASYYGIVPNGLAEDVKAYVDRPHEWNGVTVNGLPAFLVGADYIRTFNDYKYLNELEIKVELARPANLYIFFDQRVPAPQWLKDHFENTQTYIGLDEGPWPTGTPDASLGVGSGQSIDRVFTVWRRRCDKSGIITLGSMGRGAGARAMYGVAATPLD